MTGRAKHGRLDYALAAVRRGWHVFPLRAGDKTPRSGESWKALATCDPQRAVAYWAGSNDNIAVATEPSGLVVIDLDVPKPGEHPPEPWDLPGVNDGLDALALLAERAGERFPCETFTVRTRRGGLHLYFTVPDGADVRNSTGALGWCIDVRAAGGYVVAPGSYVDLPDGAGTYEVTNPEAAAPLPGWLAAAVVRDAVHHAGPGAQYPVPRGHDRRTAEQRRGYVVAALRGEVQAVLDSPPRGHNWALYQAALKLGSLIGAGYLPRDLVANALQDAGERVHTNDTPGQIAATIRSGLDAGERNPRTTSAPRPNGVASHA